MTNLPLFLDSPAFLIYSQMPSSDRKKEAEAKKKMTLSFSMTPAMAYQAFVARKFCLDESPGAYVADLQRLLSLSGHGATDEDTDPVLIEQFLVGLPSILATDMQMSLAREQLKVSSCPTKLHALQSASANSQMIAPVGCPTPVAAVAPRDCDHQAKSAVRCYNCKEAGHIHRYCPRAAERRTCFFLFFFLR